MSLVTHGFDLPIMPGSISPVLHLSQYDDARTFTAHLKGEDGNPFTLPNTATAKLEGMNCKGVTFDLEATPSGSDITFTPKEAATDQPGLIAATLHIKNGNENISTLAVILNVQRGGATKEDVARDPGFVDALQAAVSAWLEDHDPIFTLPEGGEAGQALLSDGNDGAVWGEAGIPEAVKTALLDCFRNVAWINDEGQTYYDALYAALYPPVDVLSISAVFTQGDNVIYNTNSLDDLKQYLVVTATMTDSTTRTLEDTDYTLSGTLSEGTSTITVSYGGKTATFTVTVTQDDLRLNDILTLDGIKNTRNGHDLSATTWEDLSGNENDFVKATGASNVVWNADCAVFDATNRKLGISKNLFGSASAFTIELVTKATGNGSLLFGGVYYGTVLTNRSWSENDNGFRANSYKDSSSLGISSQYAGTNVGWSNANNVISYIAWVFTGTQVIRYVNGEAKGTYEKAFPSGTVYDNWSIGGPTDSQTVFYRGNVYRIGMSASAMTAGEIAERYAFYRTRFGMD